MVEIKTVGIVGFGVMGAAIGLNSAMSGYKVIYKELNDDLVQSAYDKRIRIPLEEKVKKGKMAKSEFEHITSLITGTSRNEDLCECDLVIEAALERLDFKIELFKNIDKSCRKDTIIVSNTSTFLIETLMEKISNHNRTAGLHYFFPANKNRLVEIIKSKNTSSSTINSLMDFVESNKKIAIIVKDFPGFAINPIFISMYMVLNSFYGKHYNVATLDEISKSALGVNFGIMWVQNGSGLQTCLHAASSMNEYLANTDVGFPSVPVQLKEQVNEAAKWNLLDGSISKNIEHINVVKDNLLGTIFAISIHLIEKKVVSMQDLELGVRTALAWPEGPFTMMNKIGIKEAFRLVSVSVENGNFKMPNSFLKELPKKWEI